MEIAKKSTVSQGTTAKSGENLPQLNQNRGSSAERGYLMKKILVALLLVSTLFATLLVPAHAADPKLEAVYAEGAVDVDFDSASDVSAVYTGADATMEVKDGVLKLSTKKKTTGFVNYDYNLVFDKTAVVVNDSAKSFGFSMRFRASDANGTFLQFRSDYTARNEFAQLNAFGRFGVTNCNTQTSINKGGLETDTKDQPANQAAIDAGVTNLKNNEWHTVDVVFTPTDAANKYDFVAVIDGVIVYDSKVGEDAELENSVKGSTFNSNISNFLIKFYTNSFDGAKDWTFELDYFRAGNVELQEVIEDNGDTSDMTVSVVVAAVALVATTTVVLRKKSR